jgi:predicted ATPase/signal transduction histidine kinase
LLFLVSGTLAQYRVIETLRESGHAVVYRAIDSAQQPAILEVLNGSPPDPRDIERFENEYRVANGLVTDAIVHPIAIGLYEGRPAIAREAVRGVTLDRLCGQPMPTRQFLTLAIGAARALRDLHALGIIHRDIKPANLVVDERSGQVRLGELGLATWQPREPTAGAQPELIEGTLAYMSPEQTGRMNRAVDQRSDLYSLGLTFYEMLTGALPFAPADPLQWVHCHLAQIPRPAAEVRPGVPAMLSLMVDRLLAKTPEGRYQSCVGLLHDLEQCQGQWLTSATIEAFPLGARDVSDRWLLPQRLYGREAELQALRDAFDRVAAGAGPVLALLSGPAGVGKTALVNELQPIVRSQGIFLAGKFDQIAGAIPYATFVQALRGFVLDILTGSDAAVAEWRDRLGQALAPSGQVMVELVPALELVIGAQPPVAELGPAEAQERFALEFRTLLGTIAAPGRPLVLFLDDLQWSDVGSLALLERTIADTAAGHLMIIGALRDGEVAAGSPLLPFLDRLRGAAVVRVTLEPLAPVAVEELVAQTLHDQPNQVAPLAALVQAKTAGNPFFVRQLLGTLHQEGLISFDGRAQAWRWDMPRIATHDLTSNVAEFLAARLDRLAPATRQLLRVGACIGISWELNLVEAVLDDHSQGASLREAITEGWLVRRGASCRFTHDRVRQAAYQDIPAGQRPVLHHRIAREMLRRTPEARQGHTVFHLVNQLALAETDIVDPSERRHAAELGLLAGRRARRSSAHASAADHLGVAATFAAGSPAAELRFEIELELAGSEVLSGRLDRARERLASLLDRAPDLRRKIQVYRARQGLFLLTGEITLAVEDELAGLRACGIELPAHVSMADVTRMRQAVQELLERHPPETLSALPPMTEPEKLAAMELKTPSFFADQRLFFVHVAHMVSFNIESGLSDDASYWFGNHALALTGFGDYRLARRLGQTAYQIAQRYPLTPRPSEAAFLLGEISFWTDPYEQVIELVRTSYRLGREQGALETPSLCACVLMVMQLARGAPLAELNEEADQFLALLSRAGARDLHDLVLFQRQFIRRLRGLTRTIDTFDDQQFDGQPFEASWTPDRMSTAACWYWVHRLRASVLFGQIDQALEEGARAQALLWSSMGLVPQREFVLYRGLSLAAALDTAPPERRAEWEAELRLHERQAHLWAELNPRSFAHGHALLAAELARLEGRMPEALVLYDRSIAGAREGSFALDEALAWELAARCHEPQGPMAIVCLREARACYLRSDAQAKVRHLERAFPALATTARSFAPRATYSAPPEGLDLLSVVKASQAISEEMTVDRVTVRLMELVLAQGGASRGLLIVARGEGLAVAAEAEMVAGAAQVRTAGDPRALEASMVPLSLVQLVSRTGEAVVLEDATREPRYAADPYVMAARPRSMLCLPIRRQAKVVSLLYLENRVIDGAFTRPRLQVLELLAGQAAISLQNAGLLERSQEAVRLREEFLSVASHELNTPLAGLTLSVQALREKAEAHIAPQERARLTDLIDRQAQRLTRLVDELLDVTRLQTKQLALRLEELDLAALVGEVARRLQPQLERAGCTMSLVASGPIPVRADRGRLEQILSNLLSNAMKFGAHRPVEVRVEPHGPVARLSVSDHGIGIDLASHPRLFERFERAVSATHYGGLGLGLYICRQIVDAHAGTIQVQSRPGQGATFTVELPLSRSR